MRQKIPQRLLDKLVPEPNTGCLLWMGHTSDKGYALVRWGGRKNVKLNRLLFKLRTGYWPSKRLEMLHSCDTPQCCHEGPGGHVAPGSRRLNAQQRQERGRTKGARTYPKEQAA